MLGQSQGCEDEEYDCEQERQETKITAGQIYALLQTLKDPEFPQAAKGLDGMLAADRLLREGDATGVLIGGLSEAVWNKRRTAAELAQHKDVDVLVLDHYFRIEESFEGGVDWWLPEASRYGWRWSNGNDCTLLFGVKKKQELPSGLYILSPQSVLKMREYEARSAVSGVDDETHGRLLKQLGRNLKTRVPTFIEKAFEGKILDQNYETSAVRLSAVEVVRV